MSKLTAFTVCSGIPKFQYCYVNLHINSAGNVATSCKILVNFGPVNLEFKRLECAIFLLRLVHNLKINLHSLLAK